jgi:hypothetical protein
MHRILLATPLLFGCTAGAIEGLEGCDESVTLLDVSVAPGAGAGYAGAELAGGCSDATFAVESNAMPHFSFTALTPNPLVENKQRWDLPRDPEPNDEPTPIPLLGQIGFTVTGLPLFGPNEAERPDPYGDPVHNGIVDGCLGHTAFEYHAHALNQNCLVPEGLVAEPWTLPDPDPTEPSPVIGWALDGFPIYGPYACVDADCSEVVEMQSGYEQVGDPTTYAWDAHEYRQSSDPAVLDECNGTYGPDGTYRYHATAAFPYILGCYRGDA